MHHKNIETLQKAYEIQPKTYEELLSIPGVGAKTIRALALVSQVIYGTELQWKDPVKYSYALGGKDGIPYPVDRTTYDTTIDVIKTAVQEAKIQENDKTKALQRLSRMY
jgi:hypothetical protein